MNLEETVVSIISANTETKSGVSLCSDLRRELHLDSFGTLMVINALEETFHITVEEADFSSLNTVADVVRLLREKYQCPA